MSSSPTQTTTISAAEPRDAGRAPLEPHNPSILTQADNSIAPNITELKQTETPNKHTRKTDMSSNNGNEPPNPITPTTSTTNTITTVEELSNSVATIVLTGEQEASVPDNSAKGNPTDNAGASPEEKSKPEDRASSTAKSGSPGPVIVVSPVYKAAQPTLPQEIQAVPTLVDDPDPRLVDALNNVRDRPFILKLEQQVISFIMNSALDSFDTPPINSYYRMLVHKIAEFYRLTHIVSPVSNECVKVLKGNAARIPVVRLSDLANSKAPREPSPNNQQAVKIMRRRSPSDKGDGLDQYGNAKGDSSGLDSSRPLTREEKEAAYQLARARIFGDFKETPPDTPSPAKTPSEKSTTQRKAKEHDDGFQSRSQFFPVPPQHPSFDGAANRFSSMPIVTPGYYGPPHIQNGPSLNPTANTFNPTAGSFIPGRQPPQINPGFPHYPNGVHSGNAYPPQQLAPYTQYPGPHGAYNRTTPIHNSFVVSPPAMGRPPGPPVQAMNSPQARFPAMTPNMVPHMNSHNHHFQPQPGSSYPIQNHQQNHHPNQQPTHPPYFGYMNGGMNGTPNPNWQGHGSPLPHPAVPHNDGPVGGGYPRPAGGYNVPGRS